VFLKVLLLREGDPSLALGMTGSFLMLGEETAIRIQHFRQYLGSLCESPLLPLKP